MIPSLTLKNFQEAAEAHPEASRFILKKEGGITSIVPHTGSFYGTTIRTPSTEEIIENREMIDAFKAAARKESVQLNRSFPNQQEQQLLTNGLGAHVIKEVITNMRRVPQATLVEEALEVVRAIPLSEAELQAEDIFLAEAMNIPITATDRTWAQSTLGRTTALPEVTTKKTSSLLQR